jgi:hypothetical protein
MKLYHGTSAKYLATILKEGIRSRRETGNSNWDKFKSRPDLVYLTTAYPLYFAANATETKDGESALILEVDSERLWKPGFFPDEDFIAQVIAQREGRSLEIVQAEVTRDLEGYRHHWPASLKGMGTCSYLGPISIEAVTKYAVIDLKKRPELWLSMMDPLITIMNYKFRGEHYENFVKWVMGYRKRLPQHDEMNGFYKGAKQTKSADLTMYENTLRFWKKESADRTGFEVVDLDAQRRGVLA